MIQSFICNITEDFFKSGAVKKGCKWQAVKEVAARKLDMLDASYVLGDLKSPPNNKLEALKADLAGMHSIRINSQWILIFRWDKHHAYDARIVGYH